MTLSPTGISLADIETWPAIQSVVISLGGWSLVRRNKKQERETANQRTLTAFPFLFLFSFLDRPITNLNIGSSLISIGWKEKEEKRREGDIRPLERSLTCNLCCWTIFQGSRCHVSCGRLGLCERPFVGRAMEQPSGSPMFGL